MIDELGCLKILPMRINIPPSRFPFFFMHPFHQLPPRELRGFRWEDTREPVPGALALTLREAVALSENGILLSGGGRGCQ